LDLESVDQAAGRNCIANLRNRVENFSRDRAVLFSGKVSSSGNIDIRISTSSAAITQSIGLEWQFRVGQIKRNGPVPRVPPTTRTSRPSMI
jgi:hypothetical protein